MDELLKKLGKISLKEEENGDVPIRGQESPFLESEDEGGDEKVVVPQASDTLGNEAIDEALATLPSRWRNYVVRLVFVIVMVSAVSSMVYMGLFAFILMVFLFEVECYREMLLIGRAVLGPRGYNPFLSWYTFLVSNFLCCSSLIGSLVGLYFHLPYHLLDQFRFSVTFVLFLVSLLWFIASVKKRHFRAQLLLWIWYNSFSIFFAFVTFLTLQISMNGLIWSVLPVALVSLNDIMAYLCGFFLGRTQLTQLSPKKTWEGFIGGCLLTVILGLLLAHALCQYPYFVCPVNATLQFGPCSQHAMFQIEAFPVPDIIRSVWNVTEIRTYPFVLTHALYFTLFASIIAPFGGFFCSGFKRAFDLKDFGGVIPGHGGVMDRLDCQFLMIIFVAIYVNEVIGIREIQAFATHKFLSMFLQLRAGDQAKVLQLLQNHMSAAAAATPHRV